MVFVYCARGERERDKVGVCVREREREKGCQLSLWLDSFDMHSERNFTLASESLSLSLPFRFLIHSVSSHSHKP